LLAIQVCRTPGKVVRTRGQSVIGTGEANLFRLGHTNGVVEANALKKTQQIMKAILPPRQDLQAEVQFRMGKLKRAM
jgi:hypothetical protein